MTVATKGMMVAIFLVFAAAPLSAGPRIETKQCPSSEPVISDGVCKSQIDAFVSCVQRTAAESKELSDAQKRQLQGKVEGEVQRLIKIRARVEGVVDVEHNVVESYRREAHEGAEVQIVQTCAHFAGGANPLPSPPRVPPRLGGTATRAAFVKPGRTGGLVAAGGSRGVDNSAVAVCGQEQIEALARKAGLFRMPPPNAHISYQQGDISYWFEQNQPCPTIERTFQALMKTLKDAARSGRRYRTLGDLTNASKANMIDR
jgi:hypothetical protein